MEEITLENGLYIKFNSICVIFLTNGSSKRVIILRQEGNYIYYTLAKEHKERKLGIWLIYGIIY